MLKATLTGLMLAALVAGQLGVAALAEKGPWTSNHPYAWGVPSIPLRLTTMAGGAVLGTLGGGMKGIVDTESEFADKTFGRASENPLLVPVGIVGTVVAIPVGFLKGAPPDAAEMARDGYGWWDRF